MAQIQTIGVAGPAETEVDLTAVNRRFYERLWRGAYFVGPRRFNTWPLVNELMQAAGDGARRLEVGPGLRPRLPVEGTRFLDISEVAVAELSRRGGLAERGDAARLPYPDGAFDLVCALDIIEHVADEDAVLGELTRVMAARGTILLAVPMHPARWTTFDGMVGHARRYTSEHLATSLARHGVEVKRSAAYGMQSSNERLLDFTALGFRRKPWLVVFIYNYLVMPLGLMLQRPLKFHEGMMDTAGVDEVLLVCKRAGG